MPNWLRLLLVFLPFTLGYYLTSVFRTINALISGQLMSDLTLGAADLGLLTSVYFLAFAAAQLPVGVLLDRYGPRRVHSGLLLIAAAGAALFGAAEDFLLLVVSRSMIGLGVAAALTAGLKAIVLWFPRERLPLINGCMVMLGGLGAVSATAPAELLIDWTGWRGLFEILAAVTAGCAMLIYFVVPETATAPRSPTSLSVKTIYADRRFWRLAPLSTTCFATALALQGLWAAPWLTDVEGLARAALVRHLFIMAVALSVGAFLLGVAADRLHRRGIGLQALLAFVAVLFITAQLALITRMPLPSYLLWAVIATVGATTVLSYSIVADYFPKEVAGRANGALNVLHIGGAFVLQYAIGLVIQQWAGQDGHYPAYAYQTAFALNLALQAAALVWFTLPQLRVLGSGWAAARTRCTPFRCTNLSEPATSYQKAAYVWAEWLGSARMQANNWRLAAVGSTTVAALLGLALATTASRSSAVPYVVEVDRLAEASAFAPVSRPHRPSDAEIAYFLARLVKNVRSLSTDPIVVRANWLDAYNYLTGRAAQTLTDYAREVNPYAHIGLRPVTVDVIYVVRASSQSFEIHWKEQTYENGAVIRTERFTGIATIIVKSAEAADLLRNPLGLWVDGLSWSPDLGGAAK